MAFAGTYSALGGANLDPMYQRQRRADQQQVFAEDMRRALAGEALARSELELRADALRREDARAERAAALQKELQGAELGYRREEGAAERGLRTALQGASISSQEGMQAREISSREGMAEKELAARAEQWKALASQDAQQFGQRLNFEKRKFDREFALARQSNDREGQRSVLQNRLLDIQGQLAALELLPESLQAKAARQALEVENLRLGNDAARQGISIANRRDLREGVMHELEARAGSRALDQPALSERDQLALRYVADLPLPERKKLLQEVLGGGDVTEALKKVDELAGKGEAAAGGLTRDEESDFAELGRLKEDDKLESIGEARLKAYDKLKALGDADDEATSKRREKLRAFLKLTAGVEDGSMAGEIGWGGTWGMLGSRVFESKEAEAIREMADELKLR